MTVWYKRYESTQTSERERERKERMEYILRLISLNGVRKMKKKDISI